jgi:anti-anti-sigma regulatory factor
MSNVDTQDVGGAAVLEFSGRCSIVEAEDVLLRVKESLGGEGVSRLIFDCSAVVEADVTFVQILLSAKVTGKARGVSVELSAPAQGALAEVLERAGLTRPAEGGMRWFDSFWAGGR